MVNNIDIFLQESGSIELEVKNARFSELKNKMYSLLRQRLDEIENDVLLLKTSGDTTIETLNTINLSITEIKNQLENVTDYTALEQQINSIQTEVDNLLENKVDTAKLQNLGYLDRAKSLTGIDLNTLVENGFYSGNNFTNAPDNGFYYIEVIRHGTAYVLQRITGITGANINKTFQRVKNDAYWTAWEGMTPKIVRRYTAGELVMQLKIAPDVASSEYKVVYNLPVPNLKPTDIVVLIAQAEITNDQSYTVGIGRMLLASVNALDTTGSVIAGAPSVMSNITPDMHHEVIQINAIDLGRTGTVNYNFVAWAVSTTAGANQFTKVEQGYGGISAIVISQ